MTFETREIDLDPWKIREFGAGSGTPVVLLHGLSGSFEWWARNRDSLASHHTVAGIDLIGFGSQRRFTGSPLPLDFQESVALLRRWIESRFSDPVHLIGHSMGGQLSIHMAASHPALVRSLVLVSSSGLPVHLKPGPHLSAMFHPPGSLLSFLPVLAWDLFRAGPASVGLALARVLRDDVRPLLEHLTMPTLLVWGENDPLIPVRYADILRDAIPGSRLEILPRAGHIPMWDRPEEFNRLVMDHFESAEAGRSVTVEPSHRFSWAVRGCDGGLCYRENGDRRDVVMIHGLGIRTEYLRPLAESLDRRGLHSIAPDLPGLGHSRSTEVRDLDELVEVVAAWARQCSIEGRIWIGHSTGAQIVERLMKKYPELVRQAVFVSPVWNRERLPPLWLVEGIVRDAPKDSPHLLLIALRAYWEAGLLRIVRAFFWYTEDAATVENLPENSMIIYGESDPMIHRDFVETMGVDVHVVQKNAAHGVVFTHPDEIVELATGAPVDRRRSGSVVSGLDQLSVDDHPGHV
ncbi:MAG: alpha/beta fold hydrolase [Acidobacteria bacterium]|nr:alpha/beta fold hydrolase [Acidobacteriota bacterium]